MLNFSSDVDLAKFEPGVFGSWYLSSQVLCRGASGIVSGTQFTASGADFSSAQIAAGGILWLESADGSISGAFEIVSVDDMDLLTVSILRSNSDQDVIPIDIATGLTWRIVTYGPQAYEILWQISQRLGLQPGCSAADYSVTDIINSDSLRTASVFGTLMMVFEALYKGTDGQEVLQEKIARYQELYHTALERIDVKIDTDDDGDSERTIRPGTICLLRK